jgi:hypothetical protein
MNNRDAVPTVYCGALTTSPFYNSRFTIPDVLCTEVMSNKDFTPDFRRGFFDLNFRKVGFPIERLSPGVPTLSRSGFVGL